MTHVGWWSAGLVAASAALGQGPLATHSWSFVEVVAGTNTPVAAPDGILQPGEAARLSLSVAFSPAVGSTMTYTPPPGSGVGTVAGLGGVLFDILGSANSQGTWSFNVRAPAFSLGQAGDELAGGTGRTNAGAQQFLLPGQTANSSNPVSAIWSMVWTPASFSPRTVTWQGAAASSSPSAHTGLLIQFDPVPSYVGVYIPAQFGSVSVPIVPAPGVGAVALVGAAALMRRRR
ncbi:MAG: hypothetical protein JNM80_14635 [Phycisphaerae bacterium]|nr:hypothetical protein [Phycisphaerae bacterium]